MRNFFRSPLTWMVLAEVVVVGALVAVAWSVVGSAARPAVAIPEVAAPDAAPADSAAMPDIPSITGQASRGPLPGLNLSPSFWRARLAELNRDEVWMAQVQWRIVHAAMGAARDYVEKVVLPAVRRAEGAALG